MKHAKQKCRKLAMGKVNWSPKFHEARQNLDVWNMVVCFKRGWKINPSRICKAAKRAGIVSLLGWSMEEAL